MWKFMLEMTKENCTEVILFGVSLYMIYIGIITPPNMMEGGWIEKCAFFIVGGFFALPIGIGIYRELYDKRIDDRKTSLIQNSIKGEAEILDMKRTGYRNKLPRIKFLLKITLPDRPPYQIKHKEAVSYVNLSSMSIGTRIPVYVDPKNPKNFMFTKKLAL